MGIGLPELNNIIQLATIVLLLSTNLKIRLKFLSLNNSFGIDFTAIIEY
jgi:hypothetical protein